MKQIKIVTLMALAALLCTSCAKDDDPLAGTVPVTFVAHLPETIDSRAIADGTKANELFFWVYDENNQEIVELRQKNVEFDQTTNTSSVTAHLLPGHTYSFAFWAQHRDIDAYDPADNIIKINYGDDVVKVKCNDDDRDAFYGWIPNLQVSAEGNITRNITLSRQLAQINVGLSLSAAEQARSAGVDVINCESSLTIYGTRWIAYTGFNVSTGNPETGIKYSKRRVFFDFAEVPNEYLNVNARNWQYLAMTYFQPLIATETLVNVQIVMRDKTTKKIVFDRTFPNVSVRGTKRTNLLIRSFTEDVSFDVIIDENFDNIDYNIDL